MLFVLCSLFTAFVNVLMLTRPIFMMQVYDRVINSCPEAAMVALAAIAAFLFLIRKPQ